MRRLKRYLLTAALCAFSIAAFLPGAAMAAPDVIPEIEPGPDSPIKRGGGTLIGPVGTKEGITVAEYLALLDPKVPEGYELVLAEYNTDSMDYLPILADDHVVATDTCKGTRPPIGSILRSRFGGGRLFGVATQPPSLPRRSANIRSFGFAPTYGFVRRAALLDLIP